MGRNGAATPSSSREPVTKACDMCRKKKIRCIPSDNGCLQCTKYNTKCHFTPISQTRKPRRSAGPAYIRELDTKIQNMETRLQGVLAREHPDREFVPYHNTGRLNQSDQILTLHRGAEDLQETIEVFFNDRNWDQDNVICPEASVLAFPLKSLSHHNDIQVTTFAPRHSFTSKAAALELIQDAFRDFFYYIPLFDEYEFVQLFHQRYSQPTIRDPAWYACLNVVLSIAHLFRAMRLPDARFENDEALKYLNNALEVVSQLAVLQNSMPAIQALVCMSVILQGTPNPHVASALIAAAIRLAQAAGLHRHVEDPSLSEPKVEQRRRVFWMAYILDKDISLRTKQPFAQDDDDMDVELPQGITTSLRSCVGDQQVINVINSRISLAIIQGQIYKKLYSVRASRQSRVEKAIIARELKTILSYWRDGVPVYFEDDFEAPSHPPLGSEYHFLFVLRFTYMNCLVMISHHLNPVEPVFPVEQVSSEVPYPLAYSDSKCVDEARKALRLLQVTPQGDYAVVWMLIHPFFTTVTVILCYVLRNPESLTVKDDLQLVQPFYQLLLVLAEKGSRQFYSAEVNMMYRTCTALNQRCVEATKRVAMRVER
ncbi:fungal-specific transcription factor domain-containing protein [Xylariaceae sp. FL1272]|nr:fungal-specific transcription factor domain-containing protein [Xylariaceae sp. FL1272]